jgi:fructuronate reductase
MLHLSRESVVRDRENWGKSGIMPYQFDATAMLESTNVEPKWVHFGGGNIFRAFIAALQQSLLNKGVSDTGIITAETYDEEVIEKVYRPYDNLSLAVTMYADGRFEKEIIGSIAEALVCNTSFKEDWQKLKKIFAKPSLQIASFTITEKGYKLTDYSGEHFSTVAEDMKSGPEKTISSMGCIAALAYARYQAGQYPIAFLSLDNCSHNGDKIQEAVLAFAEQWVKNGLVDKEFVSYVNDKHKVTFPWSMIDKITPRSAGKVGDYLQKCGFGDTQFIQTRKGSYAPFVNAEKAQYLVIEDLFPNGRPALEQAGVIFTDRKTVDQVERMKVCTCLNPLHTALAVFGCVLGYTLIADELKDPQLKRLIELIGYQEGLPVVTNPGVLDPEAFIKEVLEERFPNGNLPDTPQRIATDTSQKVGIRFGETIKAYGPKASSLQYIPLAIAGWCRYLLGIDDDGNPFTISPDPLLDDLQKLLAGVKLGTPSSAEGKLTAILSNKDIFGSDLYQMGLGEKIEGYFKEMLEETHAVRNVLKKYVKS